MVSYMMEVFQTVQVRMLQNLHVSTIFLKQINSEETKMSACS